MADTQKKVIISVGADTTDLNNKIDEAQGKLGNLGNTEVGAKSVKSLKQELREATQAAQQLAAAGDDGSEAYARAVKRVAELKDAQDRVNRSVQTFDPGNKLSGLVQVAQGGAVAIQGIAGALTAVGVESETAQVAIARLQGIMAFTSAISQIDDVKEAFSDLSKVLGLTSTAQKSVATSTSVTTTALNGQTVATEGATVATNGLKAALAAVGIGILIAALAAAVEAFQSYKSAVELAKEAQDNWNKSQLTGARAQLEAELASINRTGEELLAQARVRGASAVELAKIEQDTAELTAKARKRYLDNIKGVGGDIAKAEQDLNDAIGKSKIAGYKVQEVTNAQKLKNQAEYNSKALELQKQNEASLKEIQKNEEEAQKTITNSVLSERDIQVKSIAEKYRVQIDLARQFKKDTAELEEARRIEIAAINAKFDAEELEAFKKKQVEEKAAARTVISKSLETNTLNTETTLIDTQINNQAGEGDTIESRISKLDAIYQAERELKRVQFEQELFDLEGNEAAISNLKAKYRQQELTDEQANSEAKKALYEAEKQQRIQTIGAVSNSLKSFSALAGEQTVAGKALAVASTSIDTFQSATAAFKSLAGIPVVGPALGAVAAAAAVASGLANIKKIASVQIPGKGSGGGATISAPSLANISAPVINASQLAQANQVQDVRITNPQDTTIRAVITDRDLQDNDTRREFRNNLSTI